MKTKHYRTQRKHVRNTSKRRHALGVRTHEIHPRLQVSARPSLAEIVCANAEISGGGINLVRSTVSDEEGSYLVMSIEVPSHFTAAYEAWTRFEDLPHFMRGGDLPGSHDGSRMTWRIRTLLDQFAWQARVCEQVPFDLIVWKSVQGTPHPGFGSVSFEPINHLSTWIMVQVAFDLGGVYRWLGDPLPSISCSLEQSLRRFHHSISAGPAVPAKLLSACPVHAAA